LDLWILVVEIPARNRRAASSSEIKERSLTGRSVDPADIGGLRQATKTHEKDDDPKLSNFYNVVISSAVLVARTCLGSFRSLITTW
jgi:hypothetical protein